MERRPWQILKLKQLTVELIRVDVTSQQSVDDAAAEIERRYGRLDILVNNAWIALDWRPGVESTMDVLQETFETNVFGVFCVTKAVLPRLKRSKRGRIVNLTSGNGSFGFFTNPNVPLPDRRTLLAYASSKAALNMMTVRLAIQLRDQGVKVNAADPGSTATDMNQFRGTQTVEEAAATPVRLALLPDDGATGRSLRQRWSRTVVILAMSLKHKSLRSLVTGALGEGIRPRRISIKEKGVWAGVAHFLFEDGAAAQRVAEGGGFTARCGSFLFVGMLTRIRPVAVLVDGKQRSS